MANYGSYGPNGLKTYNTLNCKGSTYKHVITKINALLDSL